MGKESSTGQEEVKFLKYATNADIAATASLDINLQADRSEYGNNFNTLIILNTSPVNIKVQLDDRDITVVNGNNGSFTFDWKDGIIYNSLRVTNLHAATATGASSIFFTYGRTGV
jgi:hypothetical protein